MGGANSIGKRLRHHKTAVYLLSNALVLACGAGLLAAAFNDTWNDVAVSLLAAGVVGVLFFYYTWLDVGDDESRQLLERSRLTGAYEDRNDEQSRDYRGLVRSARHHVDILGFGLRSFRQGFVIGDEPWPEKALVRILLIDPNFPDEDRSYADQRDVEEESTYKQNRIDVEEFARTCHQRLATSREVAAAEGQGARFDIRLFQCLPSVTIFRVDHVLYWGPYLIGRTNQQCPVVKVEAGGYLFEQLVGHFEAIWADNERSRAIPDAWLEGT
jgi:hypothetical protein